MLVVPSSLRYPQGELDLEVHGLESELKTLCKKIPKGIEHEYKVWQGTLPHLGILQYARDKDVDIIAMGSHTKEKGEKAIVYQVARIAAWTREAFARVQALRAGEG